MLPRAYIRSFRSATKLCQLSNVKLTLFSKPNCGLCDNAKSAINITLEKPLYKENDLKKNYKIVDISMEENKKWWDSYCYDIPVLHIEDKNSKESLVKIFHHITEAKLINNLKKFE
ncbi:hypothetical protein TBLA_0A10270 [Henningerozyma blattae CBS 6284]|uniref:Glutaredoxin-like protein n=1 Tax=Henningerozyma blattae (strain ATCC 34711 / CBS 6284 / DSM 70876 / NBRC 10599 / NRRL Y-10934 / UCD 77-7) TaxID=1071380 RepID=I2GXF3_HENB6|nr:hypothetical protein TBLA_0A10270 [Tetrapisispora blattae CBS 6284]CCH58805.1 hypothetical protein TBLA_0A10270 [Tetrapisispora blattae CBS 6284]